ncbi:alpha/beta fold hydrolase [Schinkia azotoformans]|uniref:alpha/beta fold hydrolase n=1 Tax=Schinkia azotoformans TaxID=1454 RepID=UPI002DC0031C|nr:alpha/beta fold hydrolase [Schinkia azotoformans]MEC1718847.1 alpha/beta fold hydrolase [Schinkia azotoformans]MED4412941.1 alpha/beta fold hydrolase [Schinkia azotoformans]
MSTFVFIHGAFLGEWCWEKVTPLLQEAGHKVITFDLPSHGNDPTPPSNVSLKDYCNAVCQRIDEEENKVILVGHSFGGMVITQVTEYRSHKIEALVYLSALIPMNGESLMILSEKYKMPPLPITLSEDQMHITLKPSSARRLFYNNCSDEIVIEMEKKLSPQPLLPYITKIEITDENYGKIPRYYIETLKDNALSFKTQREMYTNVPCQAVFTIDTDHSPFLSVPEELTTHLNNISAISGNNS